jgi:casein kinase 1
VGSFGEISSVEDMRTRRSVAAKLEPIRTRIPQLTYESKLYTIFSGGKGIPTVYD